MRTSCSSVIVVVHRSRCCRRSIEAAVRHSSGVAVAPAAGAARRRWTTTGKRIWDRDRRRPRHAAHRTGAGLDVQPRARRADSGPQSVPAKDGRRQPLLRAVGAHRRARVRSAVRVVGTRAGGAARRARAVGHRRRQVQQGRRRAAEKDATVIRLGRALFRDHKVSSELWAKTVELFGRQGAVEIVATMGDYAMAGLHADRRRSAAAGGSEADAARG